ncbi:GNAT family N-acetyltransferase [Pseudolysinimonas sp.]|uniref:GNAT family N-acetyltransferase n=1 Tax=Pseudolysinimonas sp. TaxID=2680009 RepID=UPI003F7FF1B0
MSDSDAVVHDDAHHRYVLERDGQQIGQVVYELGDGVIRVLHTEVDESLQERGLGSKLARAVLDDIRANSDRQLVPICPFFRAYLARHPEDRDLMSR